MPCSFNKYNSKKDNGVRMSREDILLIQESIKLFRQHCNRKNK